jgi:hypothetical protein
MTHFYVSVCLLLCFNYWVFKVMNDMKWKSVIFSYSKYSVLFSLFSLFCDW